MATVEVKNLEGEKVRDFELADEVFAAKPNGDLLWEATRAYLASQRRGTHSTKSRGEVSGGGKKPWRQKGTGRARVGSTRRSLWRPGPTAHGPQPRRQRSIRRSQDLAGGIERGAALAKGGLRRRQRRDRRRHLRRGDLRDSERSAERLQAAGHLVAEVDQWRDGVRNWISHRGKLKCMI